MAGIGERVEGLLPGENHAAEGSAKPLREIEAMSREDFQKIVEAQLRDLPKPLALAAHSASCASLFLICCNLYLNV